MSGDWLKQDVILFQLGHASYSRSMVLVRPDRACRSCENNIKSLGFAVSVRTKALSP